MKIRCKTTCYAGGRLYREGQVYDLPCPINEHFEGFKKPAPEDPADMTYEQLVARAKGLGLDTGKQPKKADVIKLLQEHAAKAEGGTETKPE